MGKVLQKDLGAYSSWQVWSTRRLGSSSNPRSLVILQVTWFQKNHRIQEQVLGHLMLAVYADGEGLSKEPPATDPDLEPNEPTAAAVVHEDVSVVGVLVDRPPSTHANLLVETFAN